MPDWLELTLGCLLVWAALSVVVGLASGAFLSKTKNGPRRRE